MQGLFRDSADQVLSERFRESLAAIARMRHPDQSRPDRRFLPELHGNKVWVRARVRVRVTATVRVRLNPTPPPNPKGLAQGRGGRHGLTVSEEAAQRRQPGRSLILKGIRLDGLASLNGPYLRVRRGGGEVCTEDPNPNPNPDQVVEAMAAQLGALVSLAPHLVRAQVRVRVV